MSDRGPKYENKITVVPIINVSLVVVLTLMLIAPFLSDTEQPVDLPEARASEVDDTDNVEIIFTLDKEIFIYAEQVLLEEVQPYLAVIFSRTQTPSSWPSGGVLQPTPVTQPAHFSLAI